jgi:hypothetical protein
MSTMTTATFTAYQNSDRDLLVARLVDLPGWSHIGQVRASAQLNMVEVDAHFTTGKRTISRIRAATMLGAWKLTGIK